MLRKIKPYLFNPMLSGGLLMVIGTNFANFLAYIYHLIFGRLLGPETYGGMVAIISIAGYFVSVFTFLSISIVKYASAGDDKEISDIFSFIQKKLIKPIMVLSILFLGLTPLISNFLKIEPLPIIFIGPIIFFAFLYQVYSAFLQGKLEFGKYVAANNSGWIVRIGLGLIFIYLGYSLFGIIFAYFLSMVFLWLLSKKLVGKIKINNNYDRRIGKKLAKFALPVLVMSLSTTSFISADVVLVKHYMSSFDSGIYSSLSMLGKIVFYGSAPIATAMFPMVSKKVSKNQGTKYLFLVGFLTALLLSSTVLLVFYLFPEFVVNMLYGRQYLSATTYLVWFGVFSLIFTLNYVLVNYFLSRGKTNSSYIILVGAVMQIVGIILFHNSLMRVIMVSIVSSLTILISQIAFGFRNYGFAYNLRDFKKKTKDIRNTK